MENPRILIGANVVPIGAWESGKRTGSRTIETHYKAGEQRLKSLNF